jgi:hypothetical protein
MLPPPQDTRLGARIRCFRPDHQNETSEVVQLTMLSNGRPTFKVGGVGAAVRGDRGVWFYGCGVEIMGPQNCGFPGKPQSVLIMIDPIIFTRTRTLYPRRVQSKWGGAAEFLLTGNHPYCATVCSGHVTQSATVGGGAQREPEGEVDRWLEKRREQGAACSPVRVPDVERRRAELSRLMDAPASSSSSSSSSS